MSKTEKNYDCWICGEPAKTSEHKIKNSNLCSIFGNKVTQNSPLYYNDNQGKRDLKIGSTKNQHLTWLYTLCSKCNNERTQPHDKAWDILFNAMHSRIPAIEKGTIIRNNKTFPYKTRQEMLNVHLFFVKLFGCRIVSEQIPINIESFSSSIINCKAHPYVFLKFGVFSSNYTSSIGGMSEINKSEIQGMNELSIFHWYHRLDNLTVHVMFSSHNEWNILMDSWHPSHSTNNLKICNFNEPSQH